MSDDDTTTTTTDDTTTDDDGQGDDTTTADDAASGDSAEVSDLKAALVAERKTVAALKRENAELKRQAMTDAEAAIATAKEEGLAEARKEYGVQVAEARFRAAAAGKIGDVDSAVNLAGDMGRFVADDGTVDLDAIGKAVDGFAKLGPAASSSGATTVRKGVGENGTAEPDFLREALR